MCIKSKWTMPAAVWSLLLFTSTGLLAQTQTVHRNLPAVAARLQPLARLSANTNLQLAIGLPLRNQAALTALLKQIYDPKSTNYHHYLTPQQFTAQFGPTAKDYEKVITFAQAHGLKVTATHPNRVLLDVSGPVASVEKALHVTMHVYQHPTENRTFYAPDTDPSLDLSVPIADVSGLNNFARPKPQFQTITRLPDNVSPAAHATPNLGSGFEGSYRGLDFRAAYAPGVILDGTGQTVGLLQFDGYNASDITYYETHAGLPNIPLQNVLLDGYNGAPTLTGGEVEVSLDIEMSISMATNLTQVIVYEAGPAGNWHDILNRMTTDNLAKQLSCSWYIPNGGADAVADGIFQQMAVQGQSFYDASGDGDAYTGLISFAGDSPYITQVGGTTLSTTGPGGTYVSEKVWNVGGGIGSAGGISTQYGLPSWQTNAITVASLGSTIKRNTPDVAMTADNVYVRANGEELLEGGTSCAAPLWAGFTALVNQQAAVAGHAPVGFINPAVYQIGASAKYAAAFHDIKTGNNESPSSPTLFPAVTGYDLCTGLGSPNGQALIDALVTPEPLRILPATGFASIGGVGGPFSVNSQVYSLTNLATNTLSWSMINTSSWLNASATSGILIPGVSITQLTVSLNTTASNLLVGTYNATLTFSNRTDHITQNRQFTLNIISPPVISPQPANQAPIDGGTATFNVGVTGGVPIFYQWQFNGANLTDGGQVSGSTTTTLTITNVSLNNVGTYTFVVSNAAATVVSSNATLALTPSLPVITMQPADETLVVNETATFTVSALGTKPFSYQWVYNFTNLPGSTNNPLVLTNIQFSQAGSYSVILTNANGVTNSANANLTVLPCLPDPLNLVSWWPAEGNANDVIGTNNGTIIGPVTFAPGEIGQAFSFNGTNGYIQVGGSFALAGDRTIEGWVYPSTNTGFGLPIIVGGSGHQSDYFGIAGTTGDCDVGQYNLYIDHFGTPCINGAIAVTPNQWNHVAVVFASASNHVQFFVNGVPGPVLTNTLYSYNLNTCTIGGNLQSGTTTKTFFNGLIDELSIYNRALSTNEVAGIFNAGAIGKCFVATPPFLVTQPTNQTVAVNGNTSFRVNAGGSLPLAYQWTFNTTNISGATNTTLSLTNIQLAQTGNYAVTVTSPYGFTNSANAMLTVYGIPPTITVQPVSQAVIVNGNVSFSATANGSLPLSYQWTFITTNISGATNATLLLTNVQFSQAGNYALLVTNFFGVTNSANASLTVSPTQPCTFAPTNLVSWWPAEGNANDVMGNNSGIIVGPVTFVTGEVGQAFSFNGTNGYVQVGGSTNLSGARTIEGWVYASTNTGLGLPIIVGGQPSHSDYFGIAGTSGNCNVGQYNLYIDHFGSPCFNGAVAVTPNQWNHVAVVYTGSKIQFFVNGVPGPTLTATLYDYNLNTCTIGGNQLDGTTTKTYFNGLIDELSIYSRALSTNELVAIYNGGAGGKCFNPLPPFFITQPTNQTVSVRNNTSFSVTAGGSVPLSYQWTLNAANLSGATNATLSLTNVQFAQAGNYVVIVTNPFGFTNSANASLTVSSAQQCTPHPANLVSWWPAEGDANDLIGNNNGTLVGPVTFAPGEVGQAFSFNGTNGYVQVGGSYALAGDRTIEGWVYPGTNTGFGLPIIVGGGSGQSDYFGIAGTTGDCNVGQYNLYIDHFGTACLNGAVAVTPNQWNHVAVVYTGGQVQFFVNGVPGPALTASLYDYDLNTCTIGGNLLDGTTTKTFFNGLIDELSIYNRALSTNELVTIYNAGLGGKCLNPVPPYIITPPTNQTVSVGNNTSFSVTAGGSLPFGYQWTLNTTNLPAATNATLLLTNVQLAQAGNYAVLVTNLFGFTNSADAALTVNDRLDHFIWGLILSPRFTNSPFAVEILAQDSINQVFTNFNGTVVLSSTNGVPVQPAVTSGFVQGTWVGNITISQTATNLVLRADDGSGDFGLANPIDIVRPPVLQTFVQDNSLQISWPVASPTFVLESTTSLSPANWTPVVPGPAQIGGQNFATIPFSSTNCFYRLRYSGP